MADLLVEAAFDGETPLSLSVALSFSLGTAGFILSFIAPEGVVAFLLNKG